MKKTQKISRNLDFLSLAFYNAPILDTDFKNAVM